MVLCAFPDAGSPAPEAPAAPAGWPKPRSTAGDTLDRSPKPRPSPGAESAARLTGRSRSTAVPDAKAKAKGQGRLSYWGIVKIVVPFWVP